MAPPIGSDDRICMGIGDKTSLPDRLRVRSTRGAVSILVRFSAMRLAAVLHLCVVFGLRADAVGQPQAVADIGVIDAAKGDTVEGQALWGAAPLDNFDGSVEKGCAVRQGAAVVRAWAEPVTVTQIDFHSYYWPKEKPDNKWIYGYRVLARIGEEWRLVSEFGKNPVNPPRKVQRCRSGRGYFAGQVQHDVSTGGLPVVTTALRFEIVSAYHKVAYLREIGIRGLRRALGEAEFKTLTAALIEVAAPRKPAAVESAGKPTPAANTELLLKERAECPENLAEITPLFVTGACPESVTAVKPQTPCIRATALGGADKKMPGDAAAFCLSRMRIGKNYYRSNDAMVLTLDTSALSGDVWLEFDYKTSKYGTKIFDVLLDGKTRIGRFDCTLKPHGYRQAGGRLPNGLLRGARHTLTFRETRGVYYVNLDSIQVRGARLRLIDAKGGTLTPEDLRARQQARMPHLPRNLAVPSGWRGLDFGTLDSPLWEGGKCVRVTPAACYRPGSGFGWVAGKTLIVGATVDDGDSLRGDYHTCSSGEDQPELCRFIVDLPNGRYRLMIVSGLAPYKRKERRTCDLDVNGSELLTYTFMDRRDRVLNVQSVHHRFASARVTDGALRLVWRDGNYAIINGLFIWPEGADRAGRAAAMAIIEDYYLPQALEIKPGQKSTVPKDLAARKAQGIAANRLESTTDTDRLLPTEASVPIEPHWRKRGFVMFQRPYDRPLYPYSVPTETDQADGTFLCAAARGEREPWQLALHALRDLRDVTLSISPLKGPGGAMIGAERLDVRQGRITKEGTGTRGSQYVRIAKLLCPVSVDDLARNATRLYWVTAHVPEDAAPGTYRGALTVRRAGAEGTSFDMELEVRPFALRTDLGGPQGMFWSPRYFYINAEKQLETQIADMTAHGLRTVVLYNNDGAPAVTMDGGKAVLDYSRVDHILSLLKKHGFTGPFPVYASRFRVKNALTKGTALDSEVGRRALTEMIRGMIAKYRAYGFDVYFFPWDEPSSSGPSVEGARDALKLIKECVPEAKTFCTCILPSATALNEWLDVRCYCGVKRGWAKAAEDSGDTLWEYGGVYGMACNRSIRHKAGLANARTGIRGKLYWVYCWTKSCAWFDLDSATKDTGAVRPSADGPIPIVAYECLREGIDDLNYYYTLKSLAEETNDVRAAALLRTITESMDETGAFTDKSVSAAELRERMATHIARLSSL